MVRGLRELIIKITHTAEQLATLEEITESAQAFFELADDLEIIISEFKL